MKIFLYLVLVFSLSSAFPQLFRSEQIDGKVPAKAASREGKSLKSDDLSLDTKSVAVEDPEQDRKADPAARDGKGVVIDEVSPNVKVAVITPKPLKSAAPVIAVPPVVQTGPVFDGSNFHNALSPVDPDPSAPIAPVKDSSTQLQVIDSSPSLKAPIDNAARASIAPVSTANNGLAVYATPLYKTPANYVGPRYQVQTLHTAPYQTSVATSSPSPYHAPIGQATPTYKVPLVNFAPTFHSPIVHGVPANHVPSVDGAAVYQAPFIHAAPAYHAPIVHATPTYQPPIIHAAPAYHAPIVHATPTYQPPIVHAAPVYHAEQNYPNEPSPYTYSYAVSDDYSNAIFNAVETGDGAGNAEGSYSVALPDGRTQYVNYKADGYEGYTADVTYEGAAAYPIPAAPVVQAAPAYQAQPVA